MIDEASKRVIDSVVKEDDILEENVTSMTLRWLCKAHHAKMEADIELIEQRRPMNKEMDAVYLLSPQPHIVDCLMADLERRRYRKSYVIWTSRLSLWE